MTWPIKDCCDPHREGIRSPEGGVSALAGREVALVALLLLLLGALFTWPLARHFTTDIPYADSPAAGFERVPLAQGDHLQVYYLFWLLEDSIHEGRSPLVDPYQFRYGEHRHFFFQPSLLPILFFLLSPLGPVAAYNCLVLLSFVLAGLAMYALLRLDTDDRVAALAGALVVALFPYRVGQLSGHVNGFLTFIVPTVFLFLECALRRQRWFWWALGASLAFFFAGAMEFHLIYHLSLLLAFYLPWRLLFPLTRWFERRQMEPPAPPAGGALVAHLEVLAGGLGLGIALFGSLDRAWRFQTPEGWVVTPVFTALCVWGLWRCSARSLAGLFPGPGIARELARPLAPFALLALYPLGPALSIPFAGKALLLVAAAAGAWRLVPAARRLLALRPASHGRLELRRLAPRLAVLAFGMGATLLFLVVIRRVIFAPSIAGGGRRFEDVLTFSPGPWDLFSRSPAGGEYLVYLGWFAVALALAGAFAAGRRPGDDRPRITAFFSVIALLAVILAVGPHLPQLPLYHLLYGSVPFFSFPRVAGRILAVGVVPFAATVAAGVGVVRRGWIGRRWLLGAALLALLVGDYLPKTGPGLTTLPAMHPVYDRLSRELQPGETVLALPLWPGDSAWTSVYNYWSTRYRIGFLNGYSPAVPRDYAGKIFRPLAPMNLGEVRRPQYELLRSLGIRFVLFHEDVYPAKVSPFPFAFAAGRLDESPFLETVAAEPPVRLYRLREPPPSVEERAPGTSPVGVVFEAEHWSRGASRRDDPAASGGAVAVLPAGEGKTIRHPLQRRTFPPGAYRLAARFLLPDPEKVPALTLAVRDAATGALLAEGGPQDLRGGGAVRDLEIGFQLATSTALALDVGSDGRAEAAWDFALVRFAERPEPERNFEIEDLDHIGRPGEDAQASRGRAVRMIPGYHPRDRIFTGPDRLLPAGRWIARLVLRAPGVNRGGAERFSARLSNMQVQLASVPLPSGGSDTGFRGAELSFTLERPSPVSFSADFKGWRELTLDRIEIVSAPAD